MSFNIDDYVDVAERIAQFYEQYPEGRLCMGSLPHVVDIGGKPYVWYHARAHRTPDDPLPGDGWAAEPVPGPTQFTRDSELMNAETAAWGRAIVSLGFATKKIASAQEVKARTAPAVEAESKLVPSYVPACMTNEQLKNAHKYALDRGYDFDEEAERVLGHKNRPTVDEGRKVAAEIKVMADAMVGTA